MSDQINPKREWKFYLQDMIRFAQNVQVYTEGMSQANFIASGISYDATLRNLELIGEAATHNRLIHGYLGIDDDKVWSIVQEDIPDLLPSLEEIVEKCRPA